MGYKEHLEKIIKESGKSYREIVLESKKNGNKGFTQGYLSQIKTGAIAPASEEVNYLIATICGADPEELQFEAYMESAPNIIKEFLNKISNLLFSGIESYFYKYLPKPLRKIALRKVQNEFTTYKMVSAIAKDGFGQFTIENGNLVLCRSEADEAISDDFLEIVVPTQGFIEQRDDSMQPVILQGEKVEIDSMKTPRIGEIGLFRINDEEDLVRRYTEKDGKILLVPENNKYEEKLLDLDEVEIRATVTAVTKKL